MATPVDQQLTNWFEERIPKGWFEGSPEVNADSHEILVVGVLEDPSAKGANKEAKREERVSRIASFREETRDQRVEIAQQAERLFNRKVSWGVRCADVEKMFTGLGLPVMTRLRLKERSLLDTLVASGVARSRSEALAWCVGLVSRHQKDWLDELEKATEQVGRVRRKGPDLASM